MATEQGLPPQRLTLDPPSGRLFERYERVATQSSFEAGLWTELEETRVAIAELLDKMHHLTQTVEAAWLPHELPHTRLRLGGLIKSAQQKVHDMASTTGNLEAEATQLRANADDLLLVAISDHMSWRAPAVQLGRAAGGMPPIDLANPALGDAANNVQDTTPVADRVHISPF